MEQKFIKIGKVEVPIVEENGIIYYPISFISEKVLLRSQSIINKNNKYYYNEYLMKFEVDFGYGGTQEANYIAESVLKDILSKTQQGRLMATQRKSQNRLMKYLGLPLLSTNEFIVDSISDEIWSKYDPYTRDLIQQVIELEDNLRFQMCSKCERYYPLKERFFHPDKRMPTGFVKICHVCLGKANAFTHIDEEINKARRQVGNKAIKVFQLEDVVAIYEEYIKQRLSHIPEKIKNNLSYLMIIKHLYDNGKLSKDKITREHLQDNLRLHSISSVVTMNEIYTYLFGDDYYLFPWRYKQFRFKEVNLTYDIANKVFENYLNEHGISVTNPLSLNYTRLTEKAKLRKITNQDILYFAVQYNKFNFAGYMYDIAAVNYYKDQDNRIFDMKYLIEKDLNLQIEKIPLYITKYFLQREKRTLYNVLRNYYKGNLFDWINECYPNKFIEKDFTMNPYRKEFDSIEESQIDDLLNQSVPNVFYNAKHSNKTVTINGMIPDWFIFTDNGCWIVEYFGMYLPKQIGNSRVGDYVNKTESKMKRYEDVNGYGMIFLFPDDLKDNFKGVKEKIKAII